MARLLLFRARLRLPQRVGGLRTVMRRMISRALLSLAVLCAAVPVSARQLTAQPTVAGLELPLAVIQDPSQANVRIVVEKAGLLRVLRNGALLAEPFLDLMDRVST